MLRFLGHCHQAKAKIVVGSHTHAPFADRGRAYQRELELLVEAGLSPMEAITAGTNRTNPRDLSVFDRTVSRLPVEPRWSKTPAGCLRG
jgi:hypothetical protein